jgi:hypothetical protein
MESLIRRRLLQTFNQAPQVRIQFKEPRDIVGQDELTLLAGLSYSGPSERDAFSLPEIYCATLHLKKYTYVQLGLTLVSHIRNALRRLIAPPSVFRCGGDGNE